MGAVGGEGCSAAKLARCGFGGSRYAQSYANCFGVVLGVKDGAFVSAERPEPRVVRFGVVELVEASAVSYVAFVPESFVVYGKTFGVEYAGDLPLYVQCAPGVAAAGVFGVAIGVVGVRYGAAPGGLGLRCEGSGGSGCWS